MKTLALDTSSSFSIVTLVDDGVVRASATVAIATRHEDTLLPQVDAVLRSAGVAILEIDRIVVGLGPGGFTGLRVGIATAKGLALATGVPLHGVSSLRALARGLAGASGLAGAVVDAHRGEVYAALYRFEGGRASEVLPPLHGTPDVAGARIREAAAGVSCLVGGDGLASHEEAFVASAGRDVHVAPRTLWTIGAASLSLEAEEACRLATGSELDTLEPHYVRASDAKLPAKPLRIDDGT